MSWKPVGSLVLVKMHTVGSVLLTPGGPQYNGLATVLGVGPKVEGIAVGDIVMLNGSVGPQAFIADKEHLGEDVAFVTAPLVLAVQVPDAVVES